MRETWVWSLGWEDPYRRAWQLIPVFLHGESQGQRSLVGYSPWGCKESDMTKWLSTAHTVFLKCFYLFLVVLGLRCQARAFSSCGDGGYSQLQCVSFSLQWFLLLWNTGCRHLGSVVVVHGLSLLWGMWDLPRPGIELVSPALAGRFLSTVPIGKSCTFFFFFSVAKYTEHTISPF